jgi:hypothetical protein
MQVVLRVMPSHELFLLLCIASRGALGTQGTERLGLGWRWNCVQPAIIIIILFQCIIFQEMTSNAALRRSHLSGPSATVARRKVA